MRQVFKVCNHCGKVLPIGECYAHEDRFNPEKSHYVSQDTMDATEHPATGEVFESKSAFRRTTKALGYEEIGNEYKKHPEWREQGNTKDSFDRLKEQREYRADIRADLTKQLAKWGIH